MPIATINPATGQTLKTFEALSDAQIDRKLGIAAEAFSKYRRSSFAERAQWMQRAAEILEDKKETLRADDDHGDGKDLPVGGRGSCQMRLGLPVSMPKMARPFWPTKS